MIRAPTTLTRAVNSAYPPTQTGGNITRHPARAHVLIGPNKDDLFRILYKHHPSTVVNALHYNSVQGIGG